MSADHEERIRELELKQAEYNVLIPQLMKSLDGLTAAVTSLNTYVSQAKGGWRVILTAGAALAGLIEAVRAVWSNLHP